MRSRIGACLRFACWRLSARLLGPIGAGGPSEAVKTGDEADPAEHFSHVVATEAEYYTTGPQQGTAAGWQVCRRHEGHDPPPHRRLFAGACPGWRRSLRLDGRAERDRSPLRSQRGGLRADSSATASIRRSTLSTGVCGSTPWPRLKMWPGRPAARSQHVLAPGGGSRRGRPAARPGRDCLARPGRGRPLARRRRARSASRRRSRRRRPRPPAATAPDCRWRSGSPARRA